MFAAYGANESRPFDVKQNTSKLVSYTDEVSEIFSRHAVIYHLFADDKQLSESDKVSDDTSAIDHLSSIGMRY